jgi:hypothetical protein
MSPYTVESLARLRIAELQEEAALVRRSRLAAASAEPSGTQPRRPKVGPPAREPISHAVWHGCSPATHSWAGR